MRKITLSMLLLTAACTSLNDNPQRFAGDVNENMIQTGKRIQSYFYYKPKKVEVPPPPNAAYCYRVMQDIVCYSTPICNAERRMVGWQDGEPGPTFGCSIDPGMPVEEPQTAWSAPAQTIESMPLAPPEPVQIIPAPPVAAEPASDPAPKEYTPIDKVKPK